MEYLIKQTSLNFRYCTPADKYEEPEDPFQPNEFKLKGVVDRITKFIEENGSLMAEGIKHLPFLEDGIITGPKQGACYGLKDLKGNDYLFFQIQRPCGWSINTGIKYRLILVGEKRNSFYMDALFHKLKSESMYRRYWTDEEEKTFEAEKEDLIIDKLLALGYDVK